MFNILNLQLLHSSLTLLLGRDCNYVNAFRARLETTGFSLCKRIPSMWSVFIFLSEENRYQRGTTDILFFFNDGDHLYIAYWYQILYDVGFFSLERIPLSNGGRQDPYFLSLEEKGTFHLRGKKHCQTIFNRFLKEKQSHFPRGTRYETCPQYTSLILHGPFAFSCTFCP